MVQPISLDLARSSAPIREDLAQALHVAWDRLGEPGTWWSGRDRIHIAKEARNALSCAYCARCKEALSPFTEEGEHDHPGVLPEPVVEVIHRVINDSGRLTRSWFERTIKSNLSEPAYVETVAVVVTVVAVDTFHVALGLEPPVLPRPSEGDPVGTIPRGLRKKIAWVSTVSPKDADGALKRAWSPDGRDTYIPRIQQAMSLVPKEAIAFRNLSEPLYLPVGTLMDFSQDIRAISRAQMELIAARISALNECFY